MASSLGEWPRASFIRKMKTEQKLAVLKSLNTKALVESLPKLEEEFDRTLRDDASFRNLNYGYLASTGSDCAEVKRIMAELIIQAPETWADGEKAGKRLTAPEKEAWLIKQREGNRGLANAIKRQIDVSFILDNNRIAIEMAKKRLESAKVVLGLKTAQIKFLSEGGD